MNDILISALFINVTTVGSALAGGKSDLGIAEWQPRQAVLIKLEADRRQLRSIKTDDGWSDAVESKGLEVETHFDLKTWPVWVVPAKELRINRCATTRVEPLSTVASRQALWRYPSSTKYDRHEPDGHAAAALIMEMSPYSFARDAKDALSYPECMIFKREARYLGQNP